MTEEELEERAAHTMVVTEILAILTDSMINKVLKDGASGPCWMLDMSARS